MNRHRDHDRSRAFDAGRKQWAVDAVRRVKHRGRPLTTCFTFVSRSCIVPGIVVSSQRRQCGVNGVSTRFQQVSCTRSRAWGDEVELRRRRRSAPTAAQ